MENGCRRIVSMLVAGLALTGTATTFADAGPGLRLVVAAKQRDGALVRALVEGGAPPDTAQADGATALHWAAYWNDPEMTVRLTSAGANVNAANDLGVTPLFLSSSSEDPAIALALLEAGANANAVQLLGTSPLMEAARTGRVRTIQALLQHGAAIDAREATHDQTALMWAAAHQQAEAVRVLLDGGADVHARSRARRRKAFVKTSRGGSYDPGAFERHLAAGEIVEVEQGGFTALLFAAQQGDTESARLLLAAGADVNDTAPGGMSALVVAAYSNQLEVGRLLLEHGASPDAAGAGQSALHAAILRGNLPLVTVLLAHGADVNQRVARPTGARRQSADYALGDTLVGATPAYLAAKFAEIPILRALVESNADTTIALPDGSTPLMAAMETGSINSLGGEGLGEDRRDRNVFFRAYNTQSAEAVENDVLELVRLLARTRTDVNARNERGETVLHAAALAGMNRVVAELVDKGAAVNARNRRGETPLQLAETPRRNRGGDVFAGHPETGALLRRLGAED